jgi:asparagine synthase (glutamine-hydrolysing)
MIDALGHRGPDDRGIHIDNEAGVALGHTRLSVVDLAAGRQPMSNEDDSLWITFNGEIFNHRELREVLLARGHRFRTQSDTEVILHLFEDEGPDAVRQLNGQWAFAIWGRPGAASVCVAGSSWRAPVFLHRRRGFLLFASEVKALFTHPDVCRDIDPLALDNIFTFWSTLPPRTIFKDVSELPPGHS